jgi:ABC-type bacteriocin/lantibiotic exporter with double-glycine peptidase domain
LREPWTLITSFEFFGHAPLYKGLAWKPMTPTAPKQPHITVGNMTMGYGDFILMRDLDFTVYRGDVFAIMGGSGCGKSTLMRILT